MSAQLPNHIKFFLCINLSFVCFKLSVSINLSFNTCFFSHCTTTTGDELPPFSNLHIDACLKIMMTTMIIQEKFTKRQ